MIQRTVSERTSWDLVLQRPGELPLPKLFKRFPQEYPAWGLGGEEKAALRKHPNSHLLGSPSRNGGTNLMSYFLYITGVLNQLWIGRWKEKHQLSKATERIFRFSPLPQTALDKGSDFSARKRKRSPSSGRYTSDRHYGSFMSAMRLLAPRPHKPLTEWEQGKVPVVLASGYQEILLFLEKSWRHCCRCPTVLLPGFQPQLSQVLACGPRHSQTIREMGGHHHPVSGWNAWHGVQCSTHTDTGTLLWQLRPHTNSFTLTHIRLICAITKVFL